MKLAYSFIIPVYNRPQEVKELLESFSELQFTEPFEIVIVEDGSSESSEGIVTSFSDRLNISYYFKQNSGPGASRNFGMERAKGNYFIILDSDCLLPPQYLTTVDTFLKNTYYPCFGGADAAHSSFTSLQKAINYVMTSFLTTGGIRGNKKSVTNFEPRSFNMGISKEAFQKTRGFAKIHPGEDPDLSQRILKEGFKTTFIPNAFVYHKRRISWKKFYTQVKKFGMVRPILNKWHPQASKITFWFPTCFVVFTIASVLLGVFYHSLFVAPLLFYIALIFFDATIKNKNLYIGILSVLALFIQFFGYGLAFLKSTFYIKILNKDPEIQFPQLFFK
ncbi:glycosyltransferase [Ulvibacter litoralis]|uniref:Glycosyltransferase, catalytic subunit of cellulose synthase and poly-beta-1,6-N-acetylglucosamine synthase n=1 Tax=Ulvibacter litoralis TaxID=227084 RepID=A0A1G7EMY8_9FLAO|nr:glycosyltransferase [Ulvibacter litoralis]GHC54565.1 glycosyl transferase family 2 [Ulvibacter litoralis]SDE64816.1 Glycosyltransferase, catalytic subunit of cellulose synthase and poly-beta-1,6-N-acetylglucosamine synthase [Ulvibacter litoralis]